MQNGWLREGDVLNKSLLAKQQTMHKSAVIAHGTADPSTEGPSRQIVKMVPMQRLRWILLIVIISRQDLYSLRTR